MPDIIDSTREISVGTVKKKFPLGLILSLGVGVLAITQFEKIK